MGDGELHRRRANALTNPIERIEEAQSQSALALLVPTRSIFDVRLG